MLKWIYDRFEAVIMTLVGMAILWFALSARYGLLMNVKFRWLTVAGAALMLVLGLAALGGSPQRRGWNVSIFGLLLLVVFLGKPYLHDANSMKLLEPPMEAGLWDQIDQDRFPRRELSELYMKDVEDTYSSDASFTVIGVAKRLETLDTHESFALMTSVMACCIADAFAIGFRVPYEDLGNIEDGEWFMVSGKLNEEAAKITLPNFRFGMAMMSSIDDTYYLQPETVMSFDWVDQLPQLTATLSSEMNHLFRGALQETGLWQLFEQEGPFTVFVPVDQAIEDLSGESIEDMSPAALKQFVSAHIVEGRFNSRDLMAEEELETLTGQTVTVELINGKLRINQSRLLLKDTQARNGVIHYIYPAITPDGREG